MPLVVVVKMPFAKSTKGSTPSFIKSTASPAKSVDLRCRMKNAPNCNLCRLLAYYHRQRNLRQGTINHYRQSYVQFFKPDTPIEEFDEDAYKRYVLHFLKLKCYIIKTCIIISF